MADTMQFDLVSPERSLASLQARAVQIPGSEGDMTAMPLHAPTLTTLRPGILKVEAPEGTTEYLVTGGFAQITAEGLSVLAERAIPMDEMTRAHLDELIEEARAMYKTAKDDESAHGLVEDAAKLLADMEALGTHMSL
ncbi:ATP synthase epsilon chain [Tritonibacter mobilis]|jgi:F-type H+-transporting ATPase subunit epsilon|uniref:ATP synthase epsilon chain n=1 Tax=Tritonibacter mobilis F1926 TaxID=1265309 RepID=A0A1B0ZZQ1_9RHOB|nr:MULTISPECIES: F0F1 ATP synthase subunit epsilon [Tritonibacter]EEW58987.1 ATP synthase F1, epsilon subunit [Ruegeria sp. TrichCH4B]MBW3243795.1 F0F1 ATP synthase subunit epsilon [Epibacterium sp. DP7N7-1]MCZ4267199.1 F0F1 ATP synthase subunit epsilon [Rhodobacteraceae bacterium G21628-S1]NKX38800.1 F0F1 ATP synthase subunit epsilon [Rhodobacteraceae bacterium R_SAG5]NKX74115.1 F0F1 ATP synthase subunit epsilon [Rhodobacteraceae bacterium R_SAG3]PXW77449.1 ATP synthase F1 subcomplex epsilon